jgi:endoglucanase
MRHIRLAMLAAVVATILVFAPAAAGQCLPGQCPAPPEQPPPPPPPPDPRGVDPNSPNPLVGLDLFVDKEWHPAWRSYVTLRRQGRDGEAALMYKIARQPQFKWFGTWAGYSSPYNQVRSYLRRVQEQQPGAVAQIVSMRHEGRKCGNGYTGGGRKADNRYKRWIRGFANAIGDRRVVIAFEPDSIGTVKCLVPRRRRARLNMLRYGLDVLSKLPNATVYLEGEASDWEGPGTVAKKLRYVGIHKVRGFMLNATHKDFTHRNIRFGLQVSRMTGGKPFIINTSHNGNGPMHYRKWIDRSRNLWRRVNVWCNPPNEALGEAPTTQTAHPKVDAYFWIERPGFSNGFCNGGPKGGGWWKQRALLMAKRAKWE